MGGLLCSELPGVTGTVPVTPVKYFVLLDHSTGHTSLNYCVVLGHSTVLAPENIEMMADIRAEFKACSS